jgi:hypothetical protein
MFILKKQIFFSRTGTLISIKLRANHPWLKGILNCTDKGPGPLQRGDNCKNAKMVCGRLRIFFSRTSGPE